MPAIPRNNYLSCKEAITNEVCVWSVGAGWFPQEKISGPTPGNCTESRTGTQLYKPDSTTPLEVEASPHGTPCRGLLIDCSSLPELSKTQLLNLRLWEMVPGTSGEDFQRPSFPHQEMNPLVKKSGSDQIPPSHRYYSSSLTMLEIMTSKEIRCPLFNLQVKAGYTCGVRCNISIWAESPACGSACLTHLTGCWMSITWRGTTSQWCNSLF